MLSKVGQSGGVAASHLLMRSGGRFIAGPVGSREFLNGTAAIIFVILASHRCVP
jgi:hypothetical protein